MERNPLRSKRKHLIANGQQENGGEKTRISSEQWSLWRGLDGCDGDAYLTWAGRGSDLGGLGKEGIVEVLGVAARFGTGE
jgi:hypothetical protein